MLKRDFYNRFLLYKTRFLKRKKIFTSEARLLKQKRVFIWKQDF